MTSEQKKQISGLVAEFKDAYSANNVACSNYREGIYDGYGLAQSEIERLTGIIEELVKDDNMFFCGVKKSYKEQKWQQFKKEKKL